MDIALIGEHEYIPEWNDNEKEAEPVTIILKPLCAGNRAILLELFSSVKEEKYMDFAVRHGVKEIKNLTVDGKPIKTGQELLDSFGAGLELLVLNIGTEVIVKNQRPDLKN